MARPLSPAQRANIVRYLDAELTQMDIARATGVHLVTVQRVARQERERAALEPESPPVGSPEPSETHTEPVSAPEIDATRQDGVVISVGGRPSPKSESEQPVPAPGFLSRAWITPLGYFSAVHPDAQTVTGIIVDDLKEARAIRDSLRQGIIPPLPVIDSRADPVPL